MIQQQITLITTLRRARAVVAESLEVALTSSCHIDPETLKPRRETAMKDDLPHIEELELLLLDIDETLAGAVRTFEMGRQFGALDAKLELLAERLELMAERQEEDAKALARIEALGRAMTL